MIDFNKPLQTRDGREVRIYSREAGGSYPVHGAIKSLDGLWYQTQWMASGGHLSECHQHSQDLVNVPRKIMVKGWVNVYATNPGDVPVFHPNKASANMGSHPGRLACIEIDREVEEGDGL